MLQQLDGVIGMVRRQDGFTVIELLCALVVSMVIFSASLYVLEAYMRSATRSTKRNDAQNQARLAADRITRALRNISSPQPGPALFERATGYDLVFQTVGTPSGSNTAGIQRVRYCIPQDTSQGSPALEALVSQTQTWTTTTAPANPWPASSGNINCPDSSTATSYKIATSVTNRWAGRTDPKYQAFTYNNGTWGGTDLTQITSVQLNLYVNPTPSLPQAETELRDTVFVRNQNRAPVANLTYTALGGGNVLLNGGSSYDPDGQQLTYTWSCTSPSPCPNSSALASNASGLADWSPGAGTYTVSLRIADPSGLASTATQTVTVT